MLFRTCLAFLLSLGAGVLWFATASKLFGGPLAPASRQGACSHFSFCVRRHGHRSWAVYMGGRLPMVAICSWTVCRGLDGDLEPLPPNLVFVLAHMTRGSDLQEVLNRIE